MSRISRMLIGGIIVAIIATPALSQPNVQQTNEVVKACVGIARDEEGDYNPYNWHFDAYYDPATGKVVNNAVSNNTGLFQLQQPVLFAFQKCMAERGLPLGSKDAAE